ncbi:SMP-30/gluconolactonase/LRE family protein [Daejeonia sp. YH14]|uniref:SMP-30/gluconolactonase/LRE family protein n=1 Tax=Daejeonia sp. YH14 TaxID=3439042 RepID=UPI003F496243
MRKPFAFILISGLLMLQSCNTKRLLKQNSEPVLLASGFSFTEGPAADKEGNVYFTDQPNDKIYIWTWKNNQIRLFSDHTGRANGTFFDKDGHLVSCSDDKGEIWKFSADGKSHEVLNAGFRGKRMNGPNDLWIDDDGGIYFTDPLYVRDYWKNFRQQIPEKNLYYRDASGHITLLDTFVQPNGIIGSITLKKLYVSDIDAGKTYVYDILGTGRLSEKRLFCEMGSDGMTLDNKGNLYLTGNGVTVYSAEGKKIRHIPVPEKWTSNVTFGGRRDKVLFITASESVYALPLNVSGVK